MPIAPAILRRAPDIGTLCSDHLAQIGRPYFVRDARAAFKRNDLKNYFFPEVHHEPYVGSVGP